MVREIKFRAWDTDEKIMEYDYEDSELIIEYGFHNKRYTPMQYTGLKDKNGKEIYEGDIVKFIDYNQKNSMGVIYFGRTYQGFEVVTYNNHEFSGESYVLSDLQSSLSNEEIIGNMYENPELLK